MKKTLKVMAAIAGVTLLPGPASAGLLDNLVSYYGFESDFTNTSSLSGPDGVAMNGATAGTPGGIIGNAVSLVPSVVDEELGTIVETLNQHVNVPIDFGPGATLGTAFTISAWYNLDDPVQPNGSNRYFVFESQTGFDVSFGIRNSGLGSPGVNDGQSFTQDGVSGGSNLVADAATGTWRHVVQTYEPAGIGTTITTYVDGVDAGIPLLNLTTNLADTGINFGAPRSSVSNRGFDGLIDEVAIWDTALSASDVAIVYRAGLNGVAVPAIPEPMSVVAAAMACVAGAGTRGSRQRSC